MPTQTLLTLLVLFVVAEEGVGDSLVEILKLMFGQDFKTGVLLRF